MVRRLTLDRLRPEQVPLPEDDESSEDDGDEREDYEADEDTVQTQTPVRRNLVSFIGPLVVVALCSSDHREPL